MINARAYPGSSVCGMPPFGHGSRVGWRLGQTLGRARPSVPQAFADDGGLGGTIGVAWTE